MNTILQKRIEEAAEKYSKKFETWNIEDDTSIPRGEGFEDGATFALQNQWISVEESLPPLDDGMESVSIEVVVKNEYGKATCAWYSYITNTWHLSYGEIAGDDLIDSKITHWMEIPIVQISARE